VEDHEKELQEKLVAYINTDGNGRGFFGAGGSHTLQAMVSEVADIVKDPQTGVSIKERRMARQMVSGGDGNFELSALGSGSDYTPFIQHAGIASLNIGFGGENAGGEYHTIYDTYPHYKRFKDPEFAYGIALANTAGRIVLRLANADVLPLEFTQWHATVSDYLKEIMDETDKMRKDVEKHNSLVSKNAFELAADPREVFVKPKVKEEIPYLDFTPVQNSLAKLARDIKAFESVSVEALPAAKQEALNKSMLVTEQVLTDISGLPRRSWFRHQLYAPGFYTGYGVKTLPGIREAVEQKDWKEAQEQIQKLSRTFELMDAHINTLMAHTK
jgi:N-acetylated-alpha-linked acidic dipeptidase